MATIWQLVNKSFANRRQSKAQAERQANPIDKDLPLDIHIGGKLIINHLGSKLVDNITFRSPGDTHIVEAFSRGKLFGKEFFRIMLVEEKTSAKSYLFIMKDEKGIAIRWFYELDEVIPQIPEEWEFWLSKEDGVIGQPSFKSKDGIFYNRVWVKDLKKQVAPVIYSETVYLDRYDAGRKVLVEHKCMLYGRSVGSEIGVLFDELFLVSATKGSGENSIKISVGVDIDSTELRVSY